MDSDGNQNGSYYNDWPPLNQPYTLTPPINMQPFPDPQPIYYSLPMNPPPVYIHPNHQAQLMTELDTNYQYQSTSRFMSSSEQQFIDQQFMNQQIMNQQLLNQQYGVPQFINSQSFGNQPDSYIYDCYSNVFATQPDPLCNHASLFNNQLNSVDDQAYSLNQPNLLSNQANLSSIQPNLCINRSTSSNKQNSSDQANSFVEQKNQLDRPTLLSNQPVSLNNQLKSSMQSNLCGSGLISNKQITSDRRNSFANQSASFNDQLQQSSDQVNPYNHLTASAKKSSLSDQSNQPNFDSSRLTSSNKQCSSDQTNSLNRLSLLGNQPVSLNDKSSSSDKSNLNGNRFTSSIKQIKSDQSSLLVKPVSSAQLNSFSSRLTTSNKQQSSSDQSNSFSSQQNSSDKLNLLNNKLNSSSDQPCSYSSRPVASNKQQKSLDQLNLPCSFNQLTQSSTNQYTPRYNLQLSKATIDSTNNKQSLSTNQPNLCSNSSILIPAFDKRRIFFSGRTNSCDNPPESIDDQLRSSDGSKLSSSQLSVSCKQDSSDQSKSLKPDTSTITTSAQKPWRLSPHRPVKLNQKQPNSTARRMNLYKMVDSNLKSSNLSSLLNCVSEETETLPNPMQQLMKQPHIYDRKIAFPLIQPKLVTQITPGQLIKPNGNLSTQ